MAVSQTKKALISAPETLIPVKLSKSD